MEVEVLSVRIGPGFNVLYAPAKVCRDCVEDYVTHYRFPALYVCGNRSGIVDKLKGSLHIRRAFTIHQLIEILLNSYEDVVFVEHDPLLFEGAAFSVFEDLIFLLQQVGRDRLLLYFSPKRDRIFDFITKQADRYLYVQEEEAGFYIADVGSGGIEQRFYPKRPERQLTLEVF